MIKACARAATLAAVLLTGGAGGAIAATRPPLPPGASAQIGALQAREEAVSSLLAAPPGSPAAALRWKQELVTAERAQSLAEQELASTLGTPLSLPAGSASGSGSSGGGGSSGSGGSSSGGGGSGGLRSGSETVLDWSSSSAEQFGDFISPQFSVPSNTSSFTLRWSYSCPANAQGQPAPNSRDIWEYTIPISQAPEGGGTTASGSGTVTDSSAYDFTTHVIVYSVPGCSWTIEITAQLTSKGDR